MFSIHNFYVSTQQRGGASYTPVPAGKRPFGGLKWPSEIIPPGIKFLESRVQIKWILSFYQTITIYFVNKSHS
ncbi:hypothetical protein RRG08_043039 [Elysia crispata]|uniref:Uncharacterized protein n=1 Tax=Elysia crispata TaxID=231223 RepID=A0AAE0XY43_9GAST|nr:hypothetical protein RRG08_043039 [Elysia crispata]